MLAAARLGKIVTYPGITNPKDMLWRLMSPQRLTYPIRQLPGSRALVPRLSLRRTNKACHGLTILRIGKTNYASLSNTRMGKEPLFNFCRDDVFTA